MLLYHLTRSSIRQDIRGSIAHAYMLGNQGIITKEESKQIQDGLKGILS